MAEQFWRAYVRHVTIHDSHLHRFEQDGFMEHDECSFYLLVPDVFRVRGRIRCAHGLFLEINERFVLNRYGEASLSRCKYQACVETPNGIRHIFRYDNAERKVREDHPDAFHKHIHDLKSPEGEDIRLEWVGADNWPTLGDVLDELVRWWEEIGQHEFANE